MERQQEARMRDKLRVRKMEREAQNREKRKEEEGREKADFLETLVKKKKRTVKEGNSVIEP